MRREELVMEIIGGLDDRLITEAMPSHSSHERAADTRTVAAVTPVEDIGEISKKDRVIYWVTHSLGVAAAAFLIIGAAVLLIMNWDKIAVREPDRPGEVTNVSEPVVNDNNKEHNTEEYRTGSIETSTVYGQSELFERVFYGRWEPVDVNNDANPIFLTYREDMFTFENFVYPYGITETDEIYVLPFVSNSAKECYLIKKSELGYLYKGIWEPEGEYMSENLFTIDTVNGKYRRTEAYSDDREIRPGDEISVCGLHKILGNEKYSGNGIAGRFYEEAFYTLPGGFYGGGFRVPGAFEGKGSFTDDDGTEWVIGNSRQLSTSKMYYIGGDGENTLSLALRYYEKTEYDAFAAGIGKGYVRLPKEQYFAMSFEVDDSGICRVNYKKVYEKLLSTGNYTVSDGLSDNRFEQITDTSMPRPFPEWHDTDNAQFEFQWKTKAVGAAMDCRGRENYDEWDRRCMSIRTPYRLDDNNNVAGVIKQFGITSEEIDEYFEKRNARWQESLEQAEERGNEGAIINCRNEIFSEEEINALKSGNDAEIIALFISDYSIWLTDSNYVISPEWLYYHTAEDYAAIGIEPQMIAAKIPLFEKTFTGTDNGEDLDEKSWEMFKAKLTAYAESMITVTKPEKKINLSVDTLLDLDAVTADYTYKMIEDYESDENWQNMKEWVEKTHVGENAAELLELYRSTDYFGYPDYDVQYAGNDVCDYVIRKMFGFTSFVQYNSWEMFIFVKDGKAVGATDIMKRSGLGWIVDGNDLYEVATTENILHIDLLTLEYDWIPIKEGYATIADINDDWLICGNGPLHAYNRHTGEIITPDIGEWNGLYSSLMRLNGDSIEYTKEPGNGYWYDLRTGESGEDADIYNTPILMVFESDKYRIHSYYNTVAEACPEEFDFSRISVTRKSDGLTKVFSFENLLDGRSGKTDGELLNNLILGDWFITKLSGCGRIAVNCDTGESADVSDTLGNYRIWSLTFSDDRCFVEFADDTRTAHLFGLLLCYDSAS